MRHAQDAYVARNSSDEEAARRCFRRAFDAERQAARAHVADTNAEPNSSVLLRSAASLAIECDEPREAERLAAEGLLGTPPPAIASELRDLMAIAYSMQDDSLVGRGAGDIAAICLVPDLDNAALVVVWLGDLLDRGSEAARGSKGLRLPVHELNELRSFLGSQFATTWIDHESSVRGFDDFRQRICQAEATLADCIRYGETRAKAADANEVRLTEEPSGKLSASWEELSRATKEFHRQVFPADWQPWQPDPELLWSRPIWPISLPEGSRLVRLAGVLHRLPHTQRRQLRAALVNAGMGIADLHELDTYTEMFLWDPDPDTFLPPVEVSPRRCGQTIDEAFLDKVVMVELRNGNIAASRSEPERHAAVAAASWLMETVVGGTSDPCFVAAKYAQVLAKHLAEDDLTQRIVWRVCVRILAEAGLCLEPSPASIRSLLRTAKEKSLSEVTDWLRREQSLTNLERSRDEERERRTEEAGRR